MNVYNTAVPYTHYALFVCDGVSIDNMDDLVIWMDENFFRDASTGGGSGGGDEELNYQGRIGVTNESAASEAFFRLSQSNETDLRHTFFTARLKGNTAFRRGDIKQIAVITVGVDTLPVLEEGFVWMPAVIVSPMRVDNPLCLSLQPKVLDVIRENDDVMGLVDNISISAINVSGQDITGLSGLMDIAVSIHYVICSIAE